MLSKIRLWKWIPHADETNEREVQGAFRLIRPTADSVSTHTADDKSDNIKDGFYDELPK
jgi:hypothetical protein